MTAEFDARPSIERLKEIKAQQAMLSNEKQEIINLFGDNAKVIYQNEDGTYTRFTKIDNLVELQEKGFIFRAVDTYRFTTKLENLKNKPKED